MGRYQDIQITAHDFADLLCLHLDQQKSSIPFRRLKLAMRLAMMPASLLRIYIVGLMLSGYGLIRVVEVLVT